MYILVVPIINMENLIGGTPRQRPTKMQEQPLAFNNYRNPYIIFFYVFIQISARMV